MWKLLTYGSCVDVLSHVISDAVLAMEGEPEHVMRPSVEAVNEKFPIERVDDFVLRKNGVHVVSDRTNVNLCALLFAKLERYYDDRQYQGVMLLQPNLEVTRKLN